MRQSKKTKRALTYIELSTRAFIFSIFLMGNIFILLSTATSNPIFAQGIVRNGSAQHLVAQKPLAVVSTQNREQSKEQVASHKEQEHAGHRSAPLHSSTKTSARVAAPSIAPLDLSIAANVQGGPTFQVGQTFTFDVNITNISSTTTLNSASNLTAFGIIPLGLSNIVATSSGWTINTSGSTGPATIAANYVGAPVGPGAGFAPIVITGIFNSNAVPVFTSTLGASDSTNPGTALTTFSVNVSPATQTSTVTPTSTSTVTPTGTPTVNSELGISLNVHGGPTFQVGQTLTFDVNITNTSSATTLDSTSNVTLANLAPLGLSNIVTSGSNWTVVATAANGPIVIEAVYIGPPVAPEGAFPPFEISGTLNANASPVYVNNAGVGDTNEPAGVTTNFTLNVSPATPTPTPIVNSELGIGLNVQGGPTFQVGQTLTFDVNITNTSSTTTLDSTSNVGLGDLVPLGLSNIVTSGSGWTVVATAANGPIVIDAAYNGPPVAPGGAFPPFEISGTLNANASPVFINGAGTGDTNEPAGVTTNFTLNVSPAPTVTPTPMPTVTPTPMPTVTPTPMPTVMKPQLYIVNANTGGNIYHVGQTVNYNLVVTNLPSSLAENQPITVYDVFPVGLNNMVVSASNDWTISVSSTTSPTLITARYNGLYPVAPGTVLPSISISGDLTEAAVPSFTSNATVNSADDPNPSLNTSINTIVVLESLATPTSTTAPGSGARLAIANTTTNGNHFKVGEKVNYVVVVSSDPSGGPVTTPDTFFVSYVMPLGMSEIEVKGDHWRFSSSDHTSPLLITAQYTGAYPIEPATSLPAITITGKLNTHAVGSFTTTAIVDDSVLDRPSEEETDNDDSASYTVFVQKDSNHHHQNGNGKNDHKNDHGEKNDGSSSSGSSSSRSDGTGSSNSNNRNNRRSNSSHSNNGGSSIAPLLPDTGGSPIINEF